MRKKNYWKECCLLLIGLILGCLYQKHFDPLPINTQQMMPDTIFISDTIYLEKKVPTLSKATVLDELKKQNIPHANIVLAQAIHETGNFKSKLCKTHNNLFGIRKGNQYKKYESYEHCIADYKRLFSNRYKGGDYYNYLLKIGYAEDPEYIQKIKRYVS